MFRNLMGWDIEHDAESFEVIEIISEFEGIVFDEIEDVLVMDGKVQVQEVRVIKNWRNDVLDDSVNAFNDAYGSTGTYSRNQNTFSKHSSPVRNSRKQISCFCFRF